MRNYQKVTCAGGGISSDFYGPTETVSYNFLCAPYLHLCLRVLQRAYVAMLVYN